MIFCSEVEGYGVHTSGKMMEIVAVADNPPRSLATILKLMISICENFDDKSLFTVTFPSPSTVK